MKYDGQKQNTVREKKKNYSHLMMVEFNNSSTVSCTSCMNCVVYLHAV